MQSRVTLYIMVLKVQNIKSGFRGKILKANPKNHLHIKRRVAAISQIYTKNSIMAGVATWQILLNVF